MVKNQPKNAKGDAVKAVVAAKPVQPAKPKAPKVVAQLHSGLSPARIEREVEKEVGWNVHSHGVPVIRGGGLREGHAKTRAMGNELHVMGCERLGAIGLTGSALNAGDTMLNVPLNPAAFGVRLPLLALPYAKFEFTDVKLHYIGMISEANSEANGGLYMGANFDPDSATPVGDNGLDAMATWGKNVTETPVFNIRKFLKLDLKARQSQEPLFVDSTAEQRFSTQADLLVLAGQDFAAATQNFGQLFIEYKIRLFEINQPGAMMNNLAACGSLITQNCLANALIGTPGAPGLLDKWVGDTSLTQPTDYSVTGGNLQLSKQGVYVINSWWIPKSSGAGVTDASTVPTLTCISGCQQNGVPNSNMFLGNPPGDYGNAANVCYAGQNSNNQFIDTTGTSNLTGSGQPWCIMSWTVVAQAGAIILLNGPTWNNAYAGYTNGWLTIQRITPNITDSIVTRTLPTLVAATGDAILTAQQYRVALAAPARASQLDSKTKLQLLEMVAAARASGTDAQHWNTLISVLALPTPPLSVPIVSTAVVLPILAWIVRTLGPVIATKAIGFITGKIEERIHKK